MASAEFRFLISVSHDEGAHFWGKDGKEEAFSELFTLRLRASA